MTNSRKLRNDALLSIRHRAAAFADSINRYSQAQRRYIETVKAAQDAGATQEGIDIQVQLAAKDRPDRLAALNAFAQQLPDLEERPNRMFR